MFDEITLPDDADELIDVIWTIAGRMLLVTVLGIVGFFQLYLLSMQGYRIGPEDMATIQFAYQAVGVCLAGYVALPVLRAGIERRQERFGKAMIVAAVVTTAAAAFV